MLARPLRRSPRPGQGRAGWRIHTSTSPSDPSPCCWAGDLAELGGNSASVEHPCRGGRGKPAGSKSAPRVDGQAQERGGVRARQGWRGAVVESPAHAGGSSQGPWMASLLASFCRWELVYVLVFVPRGGGGISELRTLHPCRPLPQQAPCPVPGMEAFLSCRKLWKVSAKATSWRAAMNSLDKICLDGESASQGEGRALVLGPISSFPKEDFAGHCSRFCWAQLALTRALHTGLCLWENTQILCLFLNKIVCILLLSHVYIFWILSPYQIHCLQILSPIW